MLDPIINFFKRVFASIKRWFLAVFAMIVAPFVAIYAFFQSSGLIIKIIIGFVVIVLFGGYGYFGWNTQVWSGFDTNYAAKYEFEKAEAPGTQLSDGTCAKSSVVTITHDLIDYNVNQNTWISSMLLYKTGLFGLDWDKTPFFDNQASFQRGINQAVRRTTVELVDTLGRIRGTSQIDGDLQDARGHMQFDEYRWYFGFSPFGPTTPTPSFYRSAMKSLDAYNERLSRCVAIYDPRTDNLIQFADRIASDIGSTSDILRNRSENYNSGWFDTRADDRFWFSYGQLYGYYGILKAARADFAEVVEQRNLEPIWDRMEDQLAAALQIQPAIISNGNESGWIMPTHLATMGFYILRFRSNLVEIRSILDR